MGGSRKEFLDQIISLSSTLKPEDMNDPGTYALVSQLLSLFDKKAPALPQQLVDELAQVPSAQERFAQAAHAVGATSPEALDQLRDAMKEAGLLKAAIGERLNLLKSRVDAALSKGVMQRLHPYNPDHLDDRQEENVGHWQTNGEADARESIEHEHGAARARFLHKLTGATPTRRSSDGKREFLLHRGTHEEETSRHESGGFVQHEESSSWTPNHRMAETFANGHRSKGRVMSAWIHEDSIKTVPKQYGKLAADPNPEGPKGRGENSFKDEHEVIVGSHRSRLATDSDVSHALARANPNSSDGAQSTDVHDRINFRGTVAQQGLNVQAALRQQKRSR